MKWILGCFLILLTGCMSEIDCLKRQTQLDQELQQIQENCAKTGNTVQYNIYRGECYFYYERIQCVPRNQLR